MLMQLCPIAYLIIHSVTLISQDLTFFIIQFYYNVLQLSNFT